MNKQEVMAKVALNEKDTGSPEVQVALLTAHINELNEHLKKNPNDHHRSEEHTSELQYRLESRMPSSD